jgi:malate dehydrogenase (oxaloacetate-decarboxylating)
MREDGLSDADARSHFWIVDKDGLLHSGRTDLTPEQKVYVQPEERLSNWPRTSHGQIAFAEVIRRVDATILIGLSSAAGAFNEEIVREMARKVERPIIFPLSNPTSKSEATANDLMQWTEGRAIVATGSPFDPVKIGGRTYRITQCNNIYIFPAVGLGVVASGARRITDTMILAAARTLGDHSPILRDPTAPLLPALDSLRQIAVEIATAVGVAAVKGGLCPEASPDEIRRRVIATQWTPVYPAYLST